MLCAGKEKEMRGKKKKGCNLFNSFFPLTRRRGEGREKREGLQLLSFPLGRKKASRFTRQGRHGPKRRREGGKKKKGRRTLAASAREGQSARQNKKGEEKGRKKGTLSQHRRYKRGEERKKESPPLLARQAVKTATTGERKKKRKNPYFTFLQLDMRPPNASRKNHRGKKRRGKGEEGERRNSFSNLFRAEFSRVFLGDECKR